ncbi:MAG: hypothetical protein GY801_50105 [bacterium]|nr:hypothetical protein [bacterium]
MKKWEARKEYVVCWLVLIGMLGLPLAVQAEDSLCAEVKIEIAQELTLERQAFEAHMRINNGLSHLTLENISVTVNFLDEEQKPVSATSDPNETNARFFLRIDDMENIAAVDGSGTVAPSTSADIRRLIVPAPGSGSDPPDTSQEGDSDSQEGKLYYVGATLSYTIGGETHVTEVTPDYIYVRPMPQLVLDYFLPQEVYGDDAFTLETEPSMPFSLGVRVGNQGFGTGWELKIDSAQPRIVENTQGLLIDFQILGSTVNGQPVSPSLLADFGNLAPQAAGVARWVMSCSLSGELSEFTAAFSHADSLGGSLTSLIQDVTTHFLVHDVLADLPGRDTIQDFLSTGRDEPGAAYTLFESDNSEFDVLDLSETSTLAPEDGSTTRYTLTLPALPASADDAFWYARHAVPEVLGVQETVSAVRSDGKQLPPENVWIGKTRNADRGWDYAGRIGFMRRGRMVC